MKAFIPVGQRIAAQRKRRGFSQSALAARLGWSESYVSELERGDRACDRLSLLSQLAGVLNIPLSELTGEVPLPNRQPREQHDAVLVVRRSLTGHDFLATMLDGTVRGTGDEEGLDELGARVEAAWQLTHDQRFGELAGLLESLIPDAEQFARRCSETICGVAFGLVADVYQSVSAFLAAVGETELSWVAADRAAYASERADDLLMAAAADFRMGHAFLSGGRFDDARRAAGGAAALLEEQLDPAVPEMISLWGALTLVTAIAAARSDRADEALAALRRAERGAAMLGGDRNDFHTEFGPTNVGIHAVSVAVEAGRSGEALRAAVAVDAQALSLERRARFLIDVARAHSQRGDVLNMMRTLREAEELAPEGVRHHWLVRELVHGVMRRQRRPSRDVRALASRLGIT